MYTALQISSYFINKGVTPLKLQKLLFYSQVWFYVKKRQRLFNENIQAWVLGPVVEPVWQNFRYMRRGDLINKNRADNSVLLSDEVVDHLDEVWRAYGKFTGIQLVDITHEENLWVDARQGLADHVTSQNVISIDDSVLKDFRLTKLGNIPMSNMKTMTPGLGQINGFVDETLF